MRSSILAALALCLATSGAAAAPVRGTRPNDSLRLVFLDGDGMAPVRRDMHDGASIDIGRVVAGRCLRRGCARTVTRKSFRLRIDASATTSRFVRVSAFLQLDTPGQRIRIDGRPMTSSPQLISAATPLGVAVVHTLELEVPVSEPAGSISQTIVWLVEDAR